MSTPLTPLRQTQFTSPLNQFLNNLPQLLGQVSAQQERKAARRERAVKDERAQFNTIANVAAQNQNWEALSALADAPPKHQENVEFLNKLREAAQGQIARRDSERNLIDTAATDPLSPLVALERLRTSIHSPSGTRLLDKKISTRLQLQKTLAKAGEQAQFAKAVREIISTAPPKLKGKVGFKAMTRLLDAGQTGRALSIYLKLLESSGGISPILLPKGEPEVGAFQGLIDRFRGKKGGLQDINTEDIDSILNQ